MRQDLLPTSFEGRLARFIEESAEVLKCCGKILRFGKEAIDPKTNVKYDNSRFERRTIRFKTCYI